jgi:hypothetical protein
MKMTYTKTQFHVPGSSGSLATATKRDPKQNSRGRHNANLFLLRAPQQKIRISGPIATAARQLKFTFKQRHCRFHLISVYNPHIVIMTILN